MQKNLVENLVIFKDTLPAPMRVMLVQLLLLIIVLSLAQLLFDHVWLSIEQTHHFNNVYIDQINNLTQQWSLRGVLKYQVHYGDNPSYLMIAKAISSSNYTILPKHPSYLQYHFWGLPIIVAAISKILSINVDYALISLSIVSSIGSIYFIQRIFGGGVALYFSFINCWWLKLSVFGGSEPLFMLLLMSAFYLISKRGKYLLLAAVLLSYAVLVRPIGILALGTFGAYLLISRQYKYLISSLIIGLSVALLYMGFLHQSVGNAFYNLNSSGSYWRNGDNFGIPIIVFFQNLIFSLKNAPVLSNIFILGWVAFLILATRRLFKLEDNRDFSKQHVFITIFYCGYIAFFLSLNLYSVGHGTWLDSLSRYVIPILPMALYWIKDKLPGSSYIILPLSIIVSISAVISFYGFYFVKSLFSSY